MEYMFWIAGAYIVGSIVGYRMGDSNGHRRGLSDMAHRLLADGYLKFKTTTTGDMEIIKFDEKAD